MKPLSPALLFTLCAGSLAAQSSLPAHPAEHEPVSLENFVVSASPFERAQDEIAQPTSVLAGQRLLLARQGSLGETVASEPGIASTYYGPGASRPVIRGLGGDRIRVLTGGVGTLDASVVSPDHAVSLDPLLIDRIEILRGPATLLYGGSAVGGIVNVVDTRIPEELPNAPITGRFEARAGSAARERAGAGVLSGAAGPVAWRLDGFRRRTDDVKIPGYAETAALLAEHDTDEDGPPARGRIPNTATDTRGAGSGLSFIGARGHIGVSFTGLNSLYGVPGHAHGHDEHEDEHAEEAEEAHDVRIDLRQRRVDVHGEWLEPIGALRAMKFQFGHARYRHVELEGAEIGTQFRNRGYEGRLELLHEPIGPFEGAVGVQASRHDLAAEGEEAFIPPSVTTNRALFLYEEISGPNHTWQLGGRIERQEVAPDGAGLPDRSHTVGGLAAGLVWKLDARHSIAISATHGSRAPNAQELYADGAHAGTQAYEVGDANLGSERSLGLDLGFRRRQGSVTGSVSVFVNDFRGFLFAEDTGLEDPDEELPIYRFVQRDARFHGAEAEVIVHLHDAPGHQADLRFSADYVRGTNRTDGTAIPRLTPLRFNAGFDYRVHGWSLSAEVRHSARPDRLAPNETPTGAFTVVNASLSRRLKIGRVETDVFVRGTNLFDREARLHTSFLKDVAPLPGRDLTFGARVSF